MYYEERSSPAENCTKEKVPVVDLRSDTITKPTKEMREAMFHAEVGDDVYEEDPTVKKLERQAAEMVGMEAALFMSSGTMGNLVALMYHCDIRGCEAYCGDASHIILHEQGGAAQLGGIMLCPLPNKADGTFSIDVLKSKLRLDRHHEPISKLVIVENTMDGVVLPISWLKELVAFCKERGLKLHMDGARLWNAAVGSGNSAKEIVEGFDSVTFCLSKALGSPAGSILCGNRKLVEGARRIRKVLGGGMRQVGVLAAAGLVSLEKILPLLKYDHARAKTLASSINKIGSKVIHVDLETVQTNMVFLRVNSEHLLATDFAKRLREVRPDDSNRVIVKAFALTDSLIRFVFHHHINDDDLSLAICKIESVIREMDPHL